MKKSLAVKIDLAEPGAPRQTLLIRPPDGLKPPKMSLKLKVPQLSGSQSGRKKQENPQEAPYKEKNIASLPASLLNTFSCLKVLDIAKNKLTDSSVELLMNSCPWLETLCIEDNLTCLVPSNIWKLKNLVNFRHDWVKLLCSTRFETPERLQEVKVVARKPGSIKKYKGVVGITFEVYCEEIQKIDLDDNLQSLIKKSQCSSFAQNEMLYAIKSTKLDPEDANTDIVSIESNHMPSVCQPLCAFDPFPDSSAQINKKPMSLKKQFSHQSSATKIKIENIKQLGETEGTGRAIQSQEQIPAIKYQHKDMPLHMLFSNYDQNPHGSVDIDRLLLKGHNPNTFDHNGLSPYHVAVIFKQEACLRRLLEISFKNPGFFDLQMPSMKDGRNMLHFAVFLKDYNFVKSLIDFGLPVDKRDFSGARLTHLVDQNYEFMILLRKLIKKKYQYAKTPSFLTYPEPLSQKYSRHPPRVSQESNYQIVENKNLNLMQMYEAAVGTRSNRV